MPRKAPPKRKLIDDIAARQAAIIEALGDIVYDWQPKTGRLDWSGAYSRVLGYAPDEMGRDTASWTSRVHPDDLPAVLAEVERARAARRPYDLEYRFRHRDGRYLWMHDRGVLFLDASGELEHMTGVFRDVSERRAQQQRILRLSRMRAVMSSVNALIVRTRSRAELFQEGCRIAVEHGGFGLAWIGIVQRGAIVPVARQGADGGLLADREFPLDVVAGDGCPHIAIAVQEGRPCVCNDVAHDPLLGTWREPLLALGYRSFVAHPLRAGGRTVGCLNLYAAEPGFFDDDEIKLLGELSNDISFALEFIIKDETLDFLSIYDPLTRVPNRTLFMRRLGGFVAAAQDSSTGLAVVMLDVERFKALNDAVGHAGGDQLLRLVAERLKFHAGGPSFMARIAGDRFAAVIPDIDPAQNVEALIRNGAWDRLDPPFQYDGQEFPVIFKLGLAVYPQDASDAEALLRNAELAVKHGKTTGRRLTRYTAAMGEVASRRMQLDRQLRRALQRGELEVHYQPTIDLPSGAVSGAEALLRWHNPEQGLVMPGTIVPLMEETGLILEVGHWVLEQVVRDRAAWLRDGVAVARLSINVSAVQLRERDFVDSVRMLLATSPAAARGLELEVTESVMMADPETHVATLGALRQLGVTVAMDDFGTGYSSLAYLTRLPLNAVKIDRSFILSMTQNASTMSIVAATVALARSLSLRVVAEGVETDEQLRHLRQLGCEEIQGHLFSRALPAAEFAALVRSGKRLGMAG